MQGTEALAAIHLKPSAANHQAINALPQEAQRLLFTQTEKLAGCVSLGLPVACLPAQNAVIAGLASYIPDTVIAGVFVRHTVLADKATESANAKHALESQSTVI